MNSRHYHISRSAYSHRAASCDNAPSSTLLISTRRARKIINKDWIDGATELASNRDSDEEMCRQFEAYIAKHYGC
ncbi:hypothetical protein FG078_11425 [Vibrio cholerae]|nr:hypothetical protein [Vibrio cholerae]EGR0378092.1 hypothetical protein [Vibrio cholerae]EGR0478906.1 hypothetical protein [Vibrio cholerae]EGR0509308.1 hypothetical protein [Vibrio cholerae]EGR2104031.1 hypothetical protein [Vibrio cholerae]